MTVWPFEIPRAGSLRTAFGLGGKALADHYRVVLWSEKYHELYRRYYDALLEYRVNAFFVPYGGGGAGGDIMDPRAQVYLTDERVSPFITHYTRNKDRMSSTWDYLCRLEVCGKAWVFNLDEPKSEEEYRTISSQADYVKSIVPGLKYGVSFYTGPQWDKQSTPIDKLASDVDIWIVQTNYYFQGGGDGASDENRCGMPI